MAKLQIKLSKLLLNCGFIKLKSKNKYVYSMVDSYSNKKTIKLRFKKHICIITCENENPQVFSRLDSVICALQSSFLFESNHVFQWYCGGFWGGCFEVNNDLNGVK